MTGFRKVGVLAVDVASAFATRDAGHASEKIGIHSWGLSATHQPLLIDQEATRVALGGEHPAIVGQRQGELSASTYLESHGNLTYIDGVAPTAAPAIAQLFSGALGGAPLLKMGSTVVAGSTATSVIQQDEATDYLVNEVIAVEDQVTGVVDTAYIFSSAAFNHTLGLALPNGAPAAGDIILGGVGVRWQEVLAQNLNIEAIYENASMGAQLLGCICQPSIGSSAWNAPVVVAWNFLAASFLDLAEMSAPVQAALGVSQPLVGGDGYFSIGPVGGAQTRVALDRLNLSVDFGVEFSGHENPGSPTQMYSSWVRTGSAIRVGISTDPDFDPPGSESFWSSMLRSLTPASRRIQAHFQFGRARGRTVSISCPHLELRSVNPEAVGPDGLAMAELMLAPAHDLSATYSPISIWFH
jgi:hypothetical protein